MIKLIKLKILRYHESVCALYACFAVIGTFSSYVLSIYRNMLTE